MPGIHIDFSDEVYSKIPSPKRTWVKALVLREMMLDRVVEVSRMSAEEREMAAIKLMGSAEFVGSNPDDVRLVENPESRYVFRTAEGFLVGTGVRPVDAARALGLDATVEWRTYEEAVKEGWVFALDRQAKVDPLDV